MIVRICRIKVVDDVVFVNVGFWVFIYDSFCWRVYFGKMCYNCYEWVYLKKDLVFLLKVLDNENEFKWI